MRNTFIKRLSELAAENPRIFLITGDLGFGVLEQFERSFPRQFLNAGVAEQNMTGLAAGLALEGRIVFTYSIANFPILRCLEQIRNDVCYHNANVKIVGIGGGFSYGALGFSHHATEDLAILRSLPEMTVVAPCDLWETSAAIEALVETPGPAYLRLDKSSAEKTGRPTGRFAIGRVRTLREGYDLTLLGTGGIMGEVLKAANLLASQGIQSRVLSVHTLKPFDRDAVLLAAQETEGLVTVEEHSVIGGLGGATAEVLGDAGILPRFLHRIGLPDRFTTVVGSQSYLRRLHGMDAEGIARRSLEILNGRRTVSLKKVTG